MAACTPHVYYFVPFNELQVAPPPPGPVVSQAVRQPAAGVRGAHPAGGPAPGPVPQAPVPDAHGAGRQRQQGNLIAKTIHAQVSMPDFKADMHGSSATGF